MLDLPLRAVASTRGDPNNVDIPGATGPGIPVLNTPGRNADAVAEMTLALLFGVNRHMVAADADVRAGAGLRDGTIPYQRFRAWELAGHTAGLVGLGAVGRALRWRLQGLGHQGRRLRSVQRRTPPTASTSCSPRPTSSRCTPPYLETAGMIGASAVRRHDATASSTSTPHGPSCTTPTPWSSPALRQGGRRGPGPLRGEWLPDDHPLLEMANVVLTPHIGGATWDTEARQAQVVADGLEALLSGRTPPHIVNPEVLAFGGREEREGS